MIERGNVREITPAPTLQGRKTLIKTIDLDENVEAK